MAPTTSILLSPTAVSPTDTDRPRVTATYATKTATLTPSFVPIHANNFRYLQKITETQVEFDTYYEYRFQLVFRPEAVWYASAYHAAGILFTDLDTHKDVHWLKDEPKGWQGNLVISTDGKYLASANSELDQVSLWDLDRFQKLSTFPYPSRYSLEFAGVFSANNRYLAVSDCNARARLTCLASLVMVYDLETGKTVAELAGYQTAVTGMSFSPDNRFLYMSGDGEAIRNADVLVWDLQANRRVFEVSLEGKDHFTGMALSPDGTTLLAESYSNSIYSWDTSTWDEQINDREDRIANPGFIPGTDLYLIATVQGQLVAATRANGTIEAINTGMYYTDRIVVSPDARFIYLLDWNGLLQKWGTSK